MKKILIVDDEKDIGLILEIELQNLGHQTIFFSAVEDAVNYLENNSPDIILCDFQMPKLNGLDLFLMLKDKQKNIPFYLLTGEPAMNAKNLLDKGIKDILFKPQDLLKLSILFK